MAENRKPSDVIRRTWDKVVFEKRAEERRRAEEEAEIEGARAHKAAPKRQDGTTPHDTDPFAPTRAWLEKREKNLDLDFKVGRSEIVADPNDSRAGFYCAVCQHLSKDSIAHLNHINGKLHQRNLGMSMRVKRSTLDDVKRKMEDAKQKKKLQNKEFDLEERIRRRKAEEEQERERRRQKRRNKREKGSIGLDQENEGHEENKDQDEVEEEEEYLEDEEIRKMAQMMGLPTEFGSG